MSTFHNLHFVQGNNEYDYYPQVDDTLSVEGMAADAKAVGDALDNLDSISDDVKVALLNVVSHIALWTDGQGQNYYDALRDALYGNVNVYSNATTSQSSTQTG